MAKDTKERILTAALEMFTYFFSGKMEKGKQRYRHQGVPLPDDRASGPCSHAGGALNKQAAAEQGLAGSEMVGLSPIAENIKG